MPDETNMLGTYQNLIAAAYRSRQSAYIFKKELKRAMENGYDIDYAPQKPEKPVLDSLLLWSIRTENLPVAYALIDAGADIDKPNDNGVTALILTTRRLYVHNGESFVPLFEKLLKKTRNIDAIDCNDETAIGALCWRYVYTEGDRFFLPFIKKMLHAGANPFLGVWYTENTKQKYAKYKEQLVTMLSSYLEQKQELKKWETEDCYDYEI